MSFKSFKPPKKGGASRSPITKKIQPEKQSVGKPAQYSHLAAYHTKPGQILNPKGRPKGSRNRFAEEFISDFLTDWEQHGIAAMDACLSCDPAAYLKVAATLLPKDFNLNMTDEAALDRLLSQFDNSQLSQLIGSLASISAKQTHTTKVIENGAGEEPDQLH